MRPLAIEQSTFELHAVDRRRREEIGPLTTTTRAALLTRGLRLEYVTVGWNVIEGVIAVGAGLAAGSIALIGFGVDSFVETISGAVLSWRL